MSPADSPPSLYGDAEEGRMRVMLAARAAGVKTPRVLAALEATPREAFVEPAFAAQAFDDSAVPIPCGQTLPAPSDAARLLDALEVEPTHRVLLVGAGSGYVAAALAELAAEVFAVERQAPLARSAKRRLSALKRDHVVLRVADGALGWPEEAPFERILVAAAAEDAPPELYRQLSPSGVMALPLGPIGEPQRLVRITKTPQGPYYHELCEVGFSPLLEGVPDA